MTNLATEIESYLKNSFGIVVDSHSSSLVSNGLIDSMQVVDVAMFLETLADVTLDEADLIVENFDSVDAMATLVTSKT